MLSRGAGPLLVALTQTASALPFFLLALPAGALGDIFDRRKLILATEVWMLSAATALAVLTLHVRYVEFCSPFRDAKRTGNVFIG